MVATLHRRREVTHTRHFQQQLKQMVAVETPALGNKHPHNVGLEMTFTTWGCTYNSGHGSFSV